MPPTPSWSTPTASAAKVFRSADGGDGWEKLEQEFGEIRAMLWAPAA